MNTLEADLLQFITYRKKCEWEQYLTNNMKFLKYKIGKKNSFTSHIILQISPYISKLLGLEFRRHIDG